MIKCYFSQHSALLPVKKNDGGIQLIPWGRRQHQLGHLPLGGWAPIETIRNGSWDEYFPKAVKLPINKFMEKDIRDRRQWFPLTRGQCIQGLLARYGREIGIYVVTLIPQQENALHLRWPRIIYGL